MHANIADRCVMKEKLYVYRCRMCREKSGENFALKKLNSMPRARKTKVKFLVPCHGRIFLTKFNTFHMF